MNDDFFNIVIFLFVSAHLQIMFSNHNLEVIFCHISKAFQVRTSQQTNLNPRLYFMQWAAVNTIPGDINEPEQKSSVFMRATWKG